MLSVKANLIIAVALEALISSVLLAIEPLTDFAFLSLEWPGISAAYLFLGSGRRLQLRGDCHFLARECAHLRSRCFRHSHRSQRSEAAGQAEELRRGDLLELMKADPDKGGS